MSAAFALPAELTRLLDTLTAPLAESRPVAADPRTQAIRSEIAKLTSPSGEAPDWAAIAAQGIGLLGDTGKDLLIAAYAAFALVKRHRLAGAHLALIALTQLLAAPGLTPTSPSSRAKALDWFLANLQTELRSLEPCPGDHNALRALPTALRSLRAASLEALPQHAPNFGQVIQLAEALGVDLPDAPVEPTPASLPEVEAAPPGSPAPTTPPSPAETLDPSPAEDPLRALRQAAAPWLTPIDVDNPCGPDPSGTEAFLELRTEVQKTSSIVDSGVDWSKVDARSSELLQKLAKDLRIATWFTLARYRRGGLQGMSLGLLVTADLIDTHGLALHPRQAKARRLMAEWLVNQVAQILTAIRSPVGDNDFEVIQAASQRLGSALTARFAGDAPSLRPLRDALKQLPRIEALEPDDAHASDQATQPQPIQTQTAQPAQTQATQPTQTPTTQPTQPQTQAVTAPAGVAAPTDLSQIDNFLNSTDDALVQAARAIREAQPGDPRGYRLLRVGLWLKMSAPPPVRPDGNTTLPGLADRDRDALALLTSKQQWLDLVNRSETLLRMHRLVLDLHRHTATGLAALGPDYGPATLALRTELCGFLTRFPTLSTLRDRDGRPLADPDTQRWLSEHVLPRTRPTAAPVGVVEPDAEFWTELPARLRGDARDAAFAEAQQRIDQSSTRRLRFTRGLALAEAALAAGDDLFAAHLFGGLTAEAERAALDQWDPPLLIRCLVGAAGLHHHRKDALARDAALQLLSRLDAASAVTLLNELR